MDARLLRPPVLFPAGLLLASGLGLFAEGSVAQESRARDSGAQESREVSGRRLVPVASTPRQDTAPEAELSEQDRQLIEEWVGALGDDRYRIREEAFQRLKKAGDAARSALEQAAGHDDPEVRWRVARLLDELGVDARRAPSRGLTPTRPSQAGAAPSRTAPEAAEDPERIELRQFDSLDEMFPEMEAMLRRMRSLSGEEFRGFVEGRPFQLRFFDDSFGVLDELQDELQRVQDPAAGLRPGSRWSQVEIVDGQRRSLKVQVDPRGRVRVEQGEGDDTRVVEADSMEALREQDPELADRLQAPRGGLGALRPSLRAPRPMPLPLPGVLRPGRPTLSATEPEGPMLGVQVEQVHPAVAEYLDLQPGEGLMVREVVADSLAERLGVLPRDLLLQVGGRRVRTADDVRAALQELGAAAPSVRVLRRGRAMDLRSL